MISFTGRETMLTAGLKEANKVTGFFRADAPIIEKSAAKKVEVLKNEGVESYVAAHQNIAHESNSLSFDSSVSGENFHFFG